MINTIKSSHNYSSYVVQSRILKLKSNQKVIDRNSRIEFEYNQQLMEYWIKENDIPMIEYYLRKVIFLSKFLSNCPTIQD